MRLPITLLLGQTVAILSFYPMFLYGQIWQWGISVFMYFCIMTLGMTMGYHRYLSHKCFSCPKWVEYVMVFFAHIMMAGPAIVWVANHREHHKFTDTTLDPHSPRYKGYFYSYFLTVITKIKFKYVTDLLRIPFYRAQVKYYWRFIFLWALLLYMIDPFAIIYVWLVPAGMAKLLGSFIFSYSHRGATPHNDWVLGILTSGEGFHKSHHDNPKNAVWHKHDIAGMLIKMIDKNVKA